MKKVARPVEKAASERPTDVGRYVLLPLAQAAAAATAMSVLALTVASAACIAFDLRARVALLAFLGALGATFGVVAPALMWRYATNWLWAVEKLTGHDMPFGPTHDGKVGQPDSFSVEVRQGRRVSYINSATYPQWRAFVDRMVNGDASTAEGNWCGSAGPFEKSAYLEFRDELIRRGFATWNNEEHHAQGWRLTPGGEALMRVSARELGLL